jgi:hypothetical protein
MTKQELIDVYIERIDNEIGLADGSGVGFDRDTLSKILMDLVDVVKEQTLRNNI